MATNKTKERNEVDDKDVPADFEKAINATGFGLYNLFLLLVAATGAFANTFATTTISYVLPIAECDLKLSLQDKGVLNASAYAGMIISALIWGYLADTQGRRKLLIYCYLGDAICVFMSSLSQNVGMLITFKILGGIIVNGPTAILFTYLAEMHSKVYRSRVVLVIGMMVSVSTLILSLLALGIFNSGWDFVFFESFKVHNWQIYLFACAFPSLLSGLLIICLPESPKFLMSKGRNDEALRAFQKIYAINKLKPKETYPFKKLESEVPTREHIPNEGNIETVSQNSKVSNKNIMKSMRQGFQQMKPLFRKPLVGQALQVISIQICTLMSFNTVRQWLPQLFASAAEYEAQLTSGNSKNLCSVLEYSANKTALLATNYMERCAVPTVVSIDAYINNIIVSSVSIFGFFLSGVIVSAIGIKYLITFGTFICAILEISLYWSVNSTNTLIIATIFLVIGSVSVSAIMGMIIELFPTSLRTVIVSASLMIGRVGALSGNVVFPILIKVGCIAPFLFLSISMICASALAGLLPNKKKETVK